MPVNIPNALTVLRVLLIPVFACLYSSGMYLWALFVFLLAGLTDYLDGFLARRWNQITSFGKLIDPLADKLMLLTVLYFLASSGHLPWWVFYALLGKEALMVFGALFMLREKVVVAADWAGKVATVVFLPAVFCVFPWHSLLWLHTTGLMMLYIALALSVYAFFHYAKQLLMLKKK